MERLNYHHQAVTAIANLIADREEVGDTYELHDRLEDIEVAGDVLDNT